MTDAGLSAPVLITPTDNCEPFDCGVAVLDDWLIRRALKNETSGASRTYVVLVGNTVVGYYSLATAAVVRDSAPGLLRRNMPDPIPVIVLGRLAVDRRYQNQGLGRALVRDAVLRVLQAADIVGVRAILVHAISAEAKYFYLSQGFVESPVEPMTLCLVLGTARQAIHEGV